MKLLIVSSHFPNIVGGVSDYIYHLSKTLAEEGYKICVMTSSDGRVAGDVEGSIEVMVLVEDWGIIGLPGIVKKVKATNPDRVLLQYVPYMYSRYGVPVSIALLCALLRVMGFRLVTTFHEVATGFDFRKPKYWGVTILQRLIAYVMCISSDRIIITAEAYRKTIESFDGKIRKIPVGSNILPVNFSSEEKTELKREIAPAGETVISTFGANPRRSDLLIGVAKRLRDENVRVKLLVMGGVPKGWIQTAKARVRELNLEDTVCFTGFLRAEDVYKYLSISDLFIILESVDDKGMGGISVKNTSLAAAFAAGLPVVANRGHMTDDFLRHNENIFLTSSLDEKVVSEQIKKLLTDSALTENLREGAARTFESEITWRVIAKKYTETFHGKAN